MKTGGDRGGWKTGRIGFIAFMMEQGGGERGDVPASGDGTLDPPAPYVRRSPKNGLELLTLREGDQGGRRWLLCVL